MFAQTRQLSYQEIIDLIEKCYQKKILSINGREMLLHQFQQMEQYMKKGQQITNSQLLTILGDLFTKEFVYREFSEKGQIIEKNISGIDNLKKVAITAFGVGKREKYLNHPLIHEEQSVLGKHLDKIAKDLLDIGLINSMVYEILKENIDDQDNDMIRFEADIFAQAVQIQKVYEQFENEQKKQFVFISQLVELGMMTKEQQEALLVTCEPDKLKTPFEILSYCSKVKTFTTDDYSKNHQAFYHYLFSLVQDILPAFEYEQLQFEVIPQKYQFLDMKISLWCKGVNYQHIFSYGLLGNEDKSHNCYYHDVDKKYGIFDLNAGFHGIVNKFLADTNSNYRLYFVQNKLRRFFANNLEYEYPTNQCAFILQTTEQANIWETVSQGMSSFMSSGNHHVRFNTQDIIRFINLYDEIGLLKHLTAEEKENGLAKSKMITITHLIDILEAYDCTLRIDWEVNKCYEKALKQIEKLSNGLFNPQEVIENITVDTVTGCDELFLSFLWKNQLYQFQNDLGNEYFYQYFYGFIDKILGEQGVDLSIYFLSESQMAVLLTEKQAQILREQQPELFEVF